MKIRVVCASFVFLFTFACGSKTGTSNQLCGTNQQIMSNVTSTCTGVVTSSSNTSGNNAGTSAGTNAGTNSDPGSTSGTNGGTDGGTNSAANNGGDATANFANLFANGQYNPWDVSQNNGSWNSSSAQDAVDQFLAGGGQVPAQYHIPIIAGGAGPGGGPRVQIRVADTQTVVFDRFVYGTGFVGGVRVALCDVNGDGTADLVTAPGAGGGPHITVWDGRTGSQIGSFFAYDQSYQFGTYVACADVDGDGKADIIVTLDKGAGPVVKIFSGTDPNGGTVLLNTMAPGFDPITDRAGLTVGTGDVDGDGHPEILIAHASTTSEWAVYKYGNGGLATIYPRTNANMGNTGLNISAGDVNADGHADIIIAPNDNNTTTPLGANAVVEVLSGASPSTVLASFSPYNPFQAGVWVSAGFLQRNAMANVVVGAGNSGGPHSKAFQWNGLQELLSFFFFDDQTAQQFRGGVSVAVGLAL